MTESDVRFVAGTLRREGVFRLAMILGVVVGVALLGVSLLRLLSGVAWGPSFVIGILVLLNARQNLRQGRYARILRVLTQGGALADAEPAEQAEQAEGRDDR
ncbi:MAG: hypothetical protein HRU00_09505 [Myxococcales bacterium]|nr:hypothetical protein [Myxococcales bacterium]